MDTNTNKAEEERKFLEACQVSNMKSGSSASSCSPLSDFEETQLEAALLLVRKGDVPLARGVLLADKMDTFERRELADAIKKFMANSSC
jgi:hypothetical protein